jgi:hypothetical protein
MSNNMIREEKNGLIVNRPANYTCDEKDCSICGFALRDMQDVREHSHYGCCTDCSLHFRQPNTKKWELGWRPSKKEIDCIINNNNTGDSDVKQ